MTSYRQPSLTTLASIHPDATDPYSGDAPIDGDRLIFALAARQHGAVSRAQLLMAGVSPDLLDHRLRTGRIRSLHRGITSPDR